jgi:hypothetical protein
MRTLIYDTPAEDAVFLEGEVRSPEITQETPVTFRVPIIRTNGVINIDATVALVHEMEDRMDEDIAENPNLARVPMDPPEL